ncbi:MAG: hypothetical protein ACRC0L_11695, partial [Angustibacter sp.]
MSSAEGAGVPAHGWLSRVLLLLFGLSALLLAPPASASTQFVDPGATSTYAYDAVPHLAPASSPPLTWKGPSTELAVPPEGPSISVSDAAVAANAGDDVARLYRAVDPAELKDIAGTGVYRSAPGGTEGKYFFPTKAQAEN